MLQITQFLLGFGMVFSYVRVPCFREDKELVFSWAFNYAYVGSVLLLFLKFFWDDNFAGKGQQKGKRA